MTSYRKRYGIGSFGRFENDSPADEVVGNMINIERSGWGDDAWAGIEWVTNLGGVSVKRIWSRYFSITMLKCFNGFKILNRKGKIAHWRKPFPRQKNPTAYHTCVWQKGSWSPNSTVLHWQGCIIRSILPSGMGAREVSSEHVENMEMFSCSPT